MKVKVLLNENNEIINGWESDQKRILDTLDVTKEYEVNDIYVEAWSSELWLEGFDVSFNPVCFKGIDFDIDEEISKIWEMQDEY